MIKQGKMILQDTMANILTRSVNGLRIACEPRGKALEILKAQAWVKEIREEGGALRVWCDAARFSQANGLLVGAGVAVGELVPVRQTLEEIFLSQ